MRSRVAWLSLIIGDKSAVFTFLSPTNRYTAPRVAFTWGSMGPRGNPGIRLSGREDQLCRFLHLKSFAPGEV